MAVWKTTVYDKDQAEMNVAYKQCPNRKQAEKWAESNCKLIKGDHWKVEWYSLTRENVQNGPVKAVKGCSQKKGNSKDNQQERPVMDAGQPNVYKYAAINGVKVFFHEVCTEIGDIYIIQHEPENKPVTIDDYMGWSKRAAETCFSRICNKLICSSLCEEGAA